MNPRLDPTRRALAWIEWPELDQRAWNAAIRTQDIFDEPAALDGLRPVTLRNYSKDYGRWLNFLLRTNRLDHDLPPGLRVSREAVGCYVKVLQGQNASSTVAQRIIGLERVIKVMAPDQDFKLLRRVVRRLVKQVRPARDKRSRIVPTAKLAELGVELMKEATNSIGRPCLSRAKTFRDGLILALLAMRPLRIGNLASIRLGLNLRRSGATWQLAFHGEETKNGGPFEIPLPMELAPYLDLYLERWRTVLLRQNTSDRLWVTVRGNPMSANDMYNIVVRRTEHRLGVRMHPHLFRDSLATDVAINNPAEIRIASVLLGHRRSHTTERHYNQARQREAADMWQQSLLERRRSIGRSRLRCKQCVP